MVLPHIVSTGICTRSSSQDQYFLVIVLIEFCHKVYSLSERMVFWDIRAWLFIYQSLISQTRASISTLPLIRKLKNPINAYIE